MTKTYELGTQWLGLPLTAGNYSLQARGGFCFGSEYSSGDENVFLINQPTNLFVNEAKTLYFKACNTKSSLTISDVFLVNNLRWSGNGDINTTTEDKYTYIYFGSFNENQDLPTTFAEIEALKYKYNAVDGFTTKDSEAIKESGKRSFIFAYPSNLGDIESAQVYNDLLRSYEDIDTEDLQSTNIDEGVDYKAIMYATDSTEEVKLKFKL